MEMEVNPEYLKVLGKLENVWEHKSGALGEYRKDLDEAMNLSEIPYWIWLIMPL